MSYSYSYSVWHNVEDGSNVSCFDPYSIKISLREGHLLGSSVCICMHICTFFSLPTA